MSITRVMLVDDHPLMRRGLVQLLAMEASFEVVAEASSGIEAIGLANSVQPDLILLDLNMKGMSGLDTLLALRKEEIDAQIVILTVSDNPLDIDTLVRSGADGYLLKDMEPDALIEALLKSAKGDPVFSELVQNYLDSNETQNDLFERLTDREFQILQEVAKGHRNKQIADTLFISESTVKVHMKSLLKKLEVPSRTAATVLFLERFSS